jgi:hypothetical protein
MRVTMSETGNVCAGCQIDDERENACRSHSMDVVRAGVMGEVTSAPIWVSL